MSLHQYKNLAFSVFTAVFLTAAAGYFYLGILNSKPAEMVKLTDLSDADIDQILKVKSAMYAASIETY